MSHGKMKHYEDFSHERLGINLKQDYLDCGDEAVPGLAILQM